MRQATAAVTSEAVTLKRLMHLPVTPIRVQMLAAAACNTPVGDAA